MGDENQPSKKRAAGRELSRDNPGLDDEGVPEQEMGTFKKASKEVMANRRILRVRRPLASTESSVPSSNPFAGICLFPPVPAATPTNATAEVLDAGGKTAAEDPGKKDETKIGAEVTSKESEDNPAAAAAESNEGKEKAVSNEQVVEAKQPDQVDKGTAVDVADNKTELNPTDEKETDGGAENTTKDVLANEKQADGGQLENNGGKDNENLYASAGGEANFSSFQQLSNSQNAFTGFVGTGFSSSAFSFGSVSQDGSASQSSLPTFSFGSSSNGNTPLFGSTGASLGSTSEGTTFRSMQEGPRETGEENEETVFSSDSALFEFLDGGWKERGKGKVKVNVLKDESHKARLVMRAKGNLRLILNASLYADIKLTKMDKKGISFACVNTATEGKDGLSTFALKFKDVSVVEEFSLAIAAYKGEPVAALKTPENSPKASDD